MEITLKNITKRFGTLIANDNINLHFTSGRIIGILGENGAGKSTLMKILSGYQPQDGGEIWLDSEQAHYRNPQGAVSSGIGMLQQDPLDVGAFSVLENFIFGNNALPTLAKARQSLAHITARFGFQLNPDDPTSNLSIAQRQQLEIVRLLALGVRLLILDEPTSGISASQKQQLFSTLKELAKNGMTILLVSHKLEDVVALCDEVAVLRGGRIVHTAEMPITAQELAKTMFGDIKPPPPRHSVKREKPILRLTGHLTGGRFNVQVSDFALYAGETVGLVGLDGSGQERFLRAITGLIKPQGGKLWLKEKDHTHTPYRRLMREGVFFGASGRIEEGLIKGMSLTEHTALLTEQDLTIQWQRAQNLTQERISHYQVKGKPQSLIETLSGGNQQRVLISLLPDTPTVLSLEQPTRGLDVDSASWIWEQLEARRQRGAGIVFSSAELDEVLAYSDRILVFFDGKITVIDDVTQVNVDRLGELIGGGA